VKSANPFPVPSEIGATLQEVLSYWERMRRAGNQIPFWDDLKLSDLSEVSSRLLLIDVFAGPQRFRFNLVGDDLLPDHADQLRNRFLDEISPGGKLIYLRAQATATVEALQPTFTQFKPAADVPGFGRILLPMWGNGQIDMLLGAAD
jgi:hypothetical protein